MNILITLYERYIGQNTILMTKMICGVESGISDWKITNHKIYQSIPSIYAINMITYLIV